MQKEWKACLKHCESLLPIPPILERQDILDKIEVETGRNFLFFTWFLKPENECREWTYILALEKFMETLDNLQIAASLKTYINSSTDVIYTLQKISSYLCNESLEDGAGIDLRYFYRSADGRGHVLCEAIRRIALNALSDYKDFSRHLMYEKLVSCVSREPNRMIVGYRVEEAIIMSLSTENVLKQVLKSLRDVKLDESKTLQKVMVEKFSHHVPIKINKTPGIVVYVPSNVHHPYVDAMVHITRTKCKGSVLVGIQITIQDPIPKAKRDKSKQFLCSYRKLFEDIENVPVFLLYISPTDPKESSSIHIAINQIDAKLDEVLKPKVRYNLIPICILCINYMYA